MPRLILQQDATKRYVAKVSISKHDGSIVLNLVRSGVNTFGWSSDSSRTDFDTVEFTEPVSKTKQITIHTSGRVNYHFASKPKHLFIPCLLQLTNAIGIVGYTLPSIKKLDIIKEVTDQDWIVTGNGNLESGVTFEFFVIPFTHAPLENEIWRLTVEDYYGIVCTLFKGLPPLIASTPKEAATTYFSTETLPFQAIAEDEVYLCFQKLIYVNQLKKALLASDIDKDEHQSIIDNEILNGRGILGPNNVGVWELDTTVPMRVRPRVTVEFEDLRYRADIVEPSSSDLRLEKVRVRFKVFDIVLNQYIKNPVKIKGAILDAEL